MTKLTWSALLEKGNRPRVMGIVNVTPDSFFDGGRYWQSDEAVAHGIQLAQAGADILDIGGESTKPGANPVSQEEELRRVIPVISRLKRETGLLISVDTYKSTVAGEALAAGADIINDISFAAFDSEMAPLVAAADCLYIGMHIRGTPKNMQKNPVYQDVLGEVSAYLSNRANYMIERGVSRDKIAIDPGIGFGKTDRHNLELLRGVPLLAGSGFPVLVGASRKSMMGRLLGLKVEDRLAPSLAIANFAASKGAAILRVHDVPETVSALRMWRLLSE